MIQRIAKRTILSLAHDFKALALTGPRQSGKTTLAKTIFPRKPYVSLENPEERNFALTDPVGFLARFPKGAILDEVQRTPELFSYLQQILDDSPEKGRFVLSGSNNFLLLETISQSLAGRVGFVDLLPFSLAEIQKSPKPTTELNTILFQGGYPAIAHDKAVPKTWFSSYIRTYIERDVRQIKNISNLVLFQRLLYLCAGRVGQQLNLSNLANEVGLDYKTAQAWIGIMQASYIIHLLPPYFQNFNKRIVKSPKLYFYDTGLVSYLLGISNPSQLVQHPFRGALFENFIISELLKNRFNKGQQSNLYYFRDSTGNEMDVIIHEGKDLIPVEIKSAETINESFFKNFDYWKKLTGREGGILFYGGKQPDHVRKKVSIKSWASVKSV
jgi:uncharacterized protein